jgi:hypothetical protein
LRIGRSGEPRAFFLSPIQAILVVRHCSPQAPASQEGRDQSDRSGCAAVAAFDQNCDLIA